MYLPSVSRTLVCQRPFVWHKTRGHNLEVLRCWRVCDTVGQTSIEHYTNSLSYHVSKKNPFSRPDRNRNKLEKTNLRKQTQSLAHIKAIALLKQIFSPPRGREFLGQPVVDEHLECLYIYINILYISTECSSIYIVSECSSIHINILFISIYHIYQGSRLREATRTSTCNTSLLVCLSILSACMYVCMCVYV